MFEERVSGKYIMTHIYRDGEEVTPSEVVGLLNEQQVTIEQQENEIEKLKVEKQMLEKVISNNLSDFKNGGWHRIRDLR